MSNLRSPSPFSPKAKKFEIWIRANAHVVVGFTPTRAPSQKNPARNSSPNARERTLGIVPHVGVKPTTTRPDGRTGTLTPLIPSPFSPAAKKARGNGQRGLSLIEMLLTIVIMAIAIGTVSNAVVTGLRLQANGSKTRDEYNERMRFEDKVTNVISGASLTGGSAYFVAPIPSSGSGVAPHPEDSPLGDGSASLVLTTFSEAPSYRYFTESGQEFESLNQRYGPAGPTTEVAFSLTPVGDVGPLQGLFIREQRPPDDDLTQGGQETLLHNNVHDIRFEFYDGTQWLPTWDSRNDQKGKLPSTVRVTYVLYGDQLTHSFLVRIPLAGGGQ